MADLSITAADMIPASGASLGNGTAGATITQGQAVYLDASTGTIKLADANLSAAAAAAVGISVSSAVAGQPVVYQRGGDLGFGAILTAGKIYVLSATAGGIAPAADLASGWKTTILGVATTTSNLAMHLHPSGATN